MTNHDYKIQRVDEMVFVGCDANQQYSTGNLRSAHSRICNSLLRLFSNAVQVFGPFLVLWLPYFYRACQHDLLRISHLTIGVWSVLGLFTTAPEKQARPSTFCQRHNYLARQFNGPSC